MSDFVWNFSFFNLSNFNVQKNLTNFFTVTKQNLLFFWLFLFLDKPSKNRFQYTSPFIFQRVTAIIITTNLSSVEGPQWSKKKSKIALEYCVFSLKVSRSRDKIVKPQLLPKSKQNALRIDGGDALKNERWRILDTVLLKILMFVKAYMLYANIQLRV